LRKKIIWVFMGLLISGTTAWKYRNEIFWGTPLADSYLEYVVPYLRNEKPYDAHHVISHMDNGMSIVLNSDDQVVCKSIRAYGSWERRLTKKVLGLIKPGDTILEVGANYGYYTLKMAQAIGSQGKLITYEANPAVYRILTESIKLNKLENIVQAKALAASDKPFTSKLAYNMNNIGGGYLLDSHADFEKICTNGTICEPITAVKLDDDLKDLSSVDLIRIDAEGSEINILQGAEQLLTRSPNVIIVMEWNPGMIGRYGNAVQFQEFLKEKGFKYWWKFDPENNALISDPSSEDLKSFVGDIIISKKSLPPEVLKA
jgi:FkbM family methyltransferase